MTQPSSIDEALDHALRLHQANRLAEAEAIYRQVLARQPNHADALHLLGMLAHQIRRHDTALGLIRRAISISPTVAGYYSNLALVAIALGQFDEAIAACRRALALQPRYPEALNNLGIALRRMGKMGEAIGAYRQAIALRLDYPAAQNNLASALCAKGESAEAIAICRQTLVRHPQHPETQCILGVALGEAGELDEAIAACRTALALRPDYPEALNNLGKILKDTGQIEQAVDAYRRVVEIAPDMASLWSNFLYYLYFDPRYDLRQIHEAHARYNALHAEPLEKLAKPHRNERSPDRRLRVGYFSPDFRNHCASYFTMPLLAEHDRRQFEIFCYADVVSPDEITERLKGYADVWRNIAGLSDEQAADVVRQDGIDILVDLAMHMGSGRPLLFARKPAPVQVAWLAYPGTTGLSAMDYRLTDPHLDPPGERDAWYVEKSVRLPETFWCFQPLTTIPPVGPTPAAASGQIAFGCFNNFCKVNDGAITMWAAVLRAVPNSTLLLQAAPGAHRDRLRRRMEQLGVAGDRVDFVGRMPLNDFLALYDRIDLILDTFPYNGHTTSLESLWMGVPMVTLAGQTPVSRGGLCLLTNLGLNDLVAETPEQYVDIAIRLATDLPRLAEIRRTLREKMENSFLMDRARFARNMEAAYREMWGAWCNCRGDIAKKEA